MNQIPLTAPRFDGPDLTPEDTTRLARQLDRLRDLMLDGRWRTPEQMLAELGLPATTTGITSRVRDLRKARFGGWHVPKRRVTGTAIYEYRVERAQ